MKAQYVRSHESVRSRVDDREISCILAVAMDRMDRMDGGIGFESEFESLKQILLDMAHERSLPALLSLLVERLRNLREVALARIWLIRPATSVLLARPGRSAQTKPVAYTWSPALPAK